MTQPFQQAITLTGDESVDLLKESMAIIDQGGVPCVQINAGSGRYELLTADSIVDEVPDDATRLTAVLHRAELMFCGQVMSTVTIDEEILIDRFITSETEVTPGQYATHVFICALDNDEILSR